MPIPKHRCVPGYCEPEEGIHCIADMWSENRTVDDFQWAADRNHADVKVIKVTPERDITPKRLPAENAHGQPMKHYEENRYGYLVWIRKKSDT